MNAINYRLEINYVRISLQKNPVGIAIIQNMFFVYKKNVKHDKNQINLLFFRVEVNEFFKSIRLCDTIPLLKPSFDINNVIIGQ